MLDLHHGGEGEKMLQQKYAENSPVGPDLLIGFSNRSGPIQVGLYLLGRSVPTW